MKRILITGFSPFGVRRLFSRNASEEIIRKLEAMRRKNLILRVLPVDARCEHQLEEILNSTAPDGVICMGENLCQNAGRIKVEPSAVDVPATKLPRMTRGRKVESPFAKNYMQGSSIGHFYCNRVYLKALEWAQRHSNAPVVFLHVPVFGDRDIHFDQVCAVLSDMEKELADRAGG